MFVSLVLLGLTFEFGAVCAVAFLFTVRYVSETRELAPAESGRELRAAT
jgi:hypothetical protein